ncbi:hypothetical protein [Cupriavidus malaysiensis]|nr:hypothetical protein [Cupriavidus malaysiensis]
MIDDSEWEAMRKVDILARNLYFALRRRMDFKTGIVGVAGAAVSWWALREDLEVPGRPGVKRILPSEQQLRRRVAQLEKEGLVEPIGTKLRLRFRLCKALVDNNDPKKAGVCAAVPSNDRKAMRGKGKRGYSQGNSTPQADTHQSTGNYLTLPNPSHACGAEGMTIEPPTPAAREGGQGPHASQAEGPGLSEARHEPASAVGEKRHPDEEPRPAIGWEAHLAWPVRIPPAHRAYVARMLARVPDRLRQDVLDEWQGICETTEVRHQWKMLNFIVNRARGEDWVPDHVERVRARRQHARDARAAEREAALSRAGAPAPSGPPEGWAANLQAQLRRRGSA